MMTSRSVKRGSKHSIVSRGVLLGFYECGIDDFAGKSNRHGHIVLWTQRRAGLVADKRKGKTAFWENKRQKHWMSSFEAQRNNLYIPKPKWSKRQTFVELFTILRRRVGSMECHLASSIGTWFTYATVPNRSYFCYGESHDRRKQVVYILMRLGISQTEEVHITTP